MGESIVEEWLRSLDLVHYTQSFLDNGYDDLEVCKQIGDPDLDAIGVEVPLHRSEILNAVKVLREKGGTAVYFTLENPDYVERNGLYGDYFQDYQRNPCGGGGDVRSGVGEAPGAAASGPAAPTSGQGEEAGAAGRGVTGARVTDGYMEGRRAFLIYPKLQLTAILRARLAEDGVDLNAKPYTSETGELQEEAVQALAHQYAAELKTHAKDVSDRLWELHQWNRHKDTQEEKDEEVVPRMAPSSSQDYHLISLCGQSCRSTPPPLPSCPPPSNTYADPGDVLEVLQSEPISNSPRHGSSGSQEVSTGSEEGKQETCEGKKKSSGISRFIHSLKKPSRNFPYVKPEGDLDASEITMSDEGLKQLMLLVKERKISANEAVEAVKEYETQRKHEHDTEQPSSPSPQRHTHKKDRSKISPLRIFISQKSHSLSSPSKKSSQKHGQGDEVYADTGQPSCSPRSGVKQKPPKSPHVRRSPAPSPVRKGQGHNGTDSTEISTPSPKSKKRNLFSSPFSLRRSGSRDESPGGERRGSAGMVSPFPRRKISEITPPTASLLRSPRERKGSLGSVSSPHKHLDSESSTREPGDYGAIVLSSSFEFHRDSHGRLPISPSTQSGKYRSSRAGDLGLPPVPRGDGKSLECSKVPSDTIYVCAVNRQEKVILRTSKTDECVHSRGLRTDPSDDRLHSQLSKESPISHSSSRCHENSEKDIDGEPQSQEASRLLRLPKRHTPSDSTPPESHSPKRLNIDASPGLQTHQPGGSTNSTTNHYHEGGPKYVNGVDVRTEVNKALARTESQDISIDSSPTGTMDSEDMRSKSSKYGSSSTMSLGSEASPGTGRRKKTLHTCKQRRRSNSFSTGDECMSSDCDDDDVQQLGSKTLDRAIMRTGKAGRKKDVQHIVRRRPDDRQKADPGRGTSDGLSQGSERNTGSSLESVQSGPGFQVVSSSSSHSSMSVEEEPVSKAQIVGRARVIADYTPSPYDQEALTLKKGETILVTNMNKTGIWRGLLHNRVGTFKFINVELLNTEELPSQTLRRHRKSGPRRPKPRSVDELLRRLDLQHLVSLFQLHYDTLDDFSQLEEDDLNDMKIMAAEERAKLLTAAQMVLDYDDASESPDRSLSAGEWSGTSGQSASQSPVTVSSCDSPATTTPKEEEVVSDSSKPCNETEPKDGGTVSPESASGTLDFAKDRGGTIKEKGKEQPYQQEEQEILCVSKTGEITISRLDDGTVYPSTLVEKAVSANACHEVYPPEHLKNGHIPVEACEQIKSSTNTQTNGLETEIVVIERTKNKFMPKEVTLRTFSPQRSGSLHSSYQSSSVSCQDGERNQQKPVPRPKIPQRTVSLTQGYDSSGIPVSAPSTPTHQHIHLRERRSSSGGRHQRSSRSTTPPSKRPDDPHLVCVSPIASSPKVKTATVRHLPSASPVATRNIKSMVAMGTCSHKPPESPSRSCVSLIHTSVGGSPGGKHLSREVKLRQSSSPSRSCRRPGSGSITSVIATKLDEDGIDLADPPYTAEDNSSTVPASLVQRYATAMGRAEEEVWAVMEELRLRQLGFQTSSSSSLDSECHRLSATSSPTRSPRSSLTLTSFLGALGLSRYLPDLTSNNITVLEDLLGLVEPDLRKVGVRDSRHLQKLLKAMETQRSRDDRVSGQPHSSSSSIPPSVPSGPSSSSSTAASASATASPHTHSRHSSTRISKLSKVMDKV